MATALLVIDVQNVYTDPDSDLFCRDAKKTIGRINQLIDKFQREKHPIIFVRHMHQSNGSDLGRMFDYLGEAPEDFNFKEGSDEVKFDSNLRRPEKSFELRKARYSAFAGTDLDARLRRLGVKRVVICGFMTNCCCDSTAREAHDKDSFVDFVTEATGTPGTEDLKESEVRSVISNLMEAAYARVLTTRKCLNQRYSD